MSEETKVVEPKPMPDLDPKTEPTRFEFSLPLEKQPDIITLNGVEYVPKPIVELTEKELRLLDEAERQIAMYRALAARTGVPKQSAVFLLGIEPLMRYLEA